MPMTMPDASSSGTSFRILAKGIFCPVARRYSPISTAAKMARYSASSPEDTGMFRTNGPRVPNMIMDAISISRGFLNFLINLALLLI